MLSSFLLLALSAIEIEIRFPLLERQLAQKMFSQDGRKYVKGNPQSRCNFAYLAQPRFSSSDGRLRITALFSGKSSLDLFGKCIGFGDSFDFEILSALTAQTGTLRLAQPQVRILSRDTFYSRQVLKALQKSIPDAIQYPIRDEIQKLLSASSSAAAYKISIPKVEIRRVQVLKDSLLVDVDTRLLVE
ncbi:MAG: hypothetical protein K7J46_21700 [Bryobacter sp.]|jgi:hypothetical protein|nr:hypothetical protein [Bryobacter sp. CoA8 C33]